MITESFIKGHEYQEFKQILGDTLLHKPIKIKTEGKTNERRMNMENEICGLNIHCEDCDREDCDILSGKYELLKRQDLRRSNYIKDKKKSDTN